MGENQASRYFLYALGEIALVVIGILIALQINNWNEWRKDRLQEKIVLTDLRKNIERNSELLEESINRIHMLNVSTEVILSALDEEIPYHDSLQRHFFLALLRGQMYGITSRDGYESFKNAGFDIIQSDSLKTRILYLFEVVYRSANEWRRYSHDYTSSDNPIWNKYFIHLGDRIKPYDFNQMLESREIYSLARNVYAVRNTYREWQEKSLKESRAVLEMIYTSLDEGKH